MLSKPRWNLLAIPLAALLVAPVALAAAGVAPEPAESLVPPLASHPGNTVWVSSFNDGSLSPWTVGPCDNGSASITPEGMSGTYGVRIVDGTDWNACSLVGPSADSSEGTSYVLGAWLRGGSGSGDLYLEFRNAGGTRIGVAWTSVPALPAWQHVAVPGVAPAGTATVNARLYANVGNVGTAFWDQVTLSGAIDPTP